MTYSPEMASGIYYLHFSIIANQHLPGIKYETELTLPLFIYDFIYTVKAFQFSLIAISFYLTSIGESHHSLLHSLFKLF